MYKQLPDTQDERDREAKFWAAKLHPDDYTRLTTYERELLQEIQDGKAVTRVRLLEVREILARVEKERNHGG